MIRDCGCDRRQTRFRLGCLQCGAGCCPACAVPVESVTYCRRCARVLLGPGVRTPGTFELH